jgi:hypothetical protein
MPPNVVHHHPLPCQQFCLRLSARAQTRRGVVILGVDALSFARRELTMLSMISQYVTRGDCVVADVSAISVQLVTLLHPYLRPNRKNRLKDPSRDDPKIRVLRIVSDLIERVEDPTRFVPFYCSLASPGPHALETGARRGLVALLAALAKHPKLKATRLSVVAGLFGEMNAVDETRIGSGPDFDRWVRVFGVGGGGWRGVVVVVVAGYFLRVSPSPLRRSRTHERTVSQSLVVVIRFTSFFLHPLPLSPQDPGRL